MSEPASTAQKWLIHLVTIIFAIPMAVVGMSWLVLKVFS